MFYATNRGLGHKCIDPFSLIYFFSKIIEDYAEEYCLSAGTPSALMFAKQVTMKLHKITIKNQT